MRVRELLDSPALSLELRVPAPAERLDRSITACAQSELMDPTPFLMRGEFVLTSGMGLRFEDPRTWDAYVERLVRAGASGLGFGSGIIHARVPAGLVAACEAHGLPLFELSPDLPPVMLSRHIWQALAAERHELARRGWDLANECTRLATEGATPARILERVSAALGANVRLVDGSGFTLAQAGDLVVAPGAGTRSTLPLPGGEHTRFQLRIESAGDAVLLQPLLGPAAAVLGMQLSYTLAARSPLHSHSGARFIEAFLDRRGAARDTLRPVTVAAGFAPDDDFGMIVLRRPEHVSAALLRLVVWRLRILLDEHWRSVEFYDEAYQTTLILQGPVGRLELGRILRSALDRTADIDAGYATGLSLDELGIVVPVARRAPLVAGAHPVPTLDLAALVGALPAPGLLAVARRTVAPLLAGDGVLLATLRAYLELGGSTKRVCDRLFIHRNTLGYRLRRIEQLLGVDLADGRARATLLLALDLAAQDADGSGLTGSSEGQETPPAGAV